MICTSNETVTKPLKYIKNNKCSCSVETENRARMGCSIPRTKIVKNKNIKHGLILK